MLLSPYRVIDLTHQYGLLCGQIYADLGAEVIQVEPPGGIAARALAPFEQIGMENERSLVWQGYSRGKKSVELDTKENREVFLDLVATSDFLIEDLGVRRLEQLGLGYEDLRAVNPRLIYISITPFGLSGPKAHWAASDITIAASSGPMSMTGDDDRPPARVSVPQAWHHAAAEAMTGGLVALQERHNSGVGQRVEVSAQQAMTLATQGNILSAAVGDTTVQRIAGGIKAGELRIRLTYPALDGFVSITHIFGATVGPATARLMEYVYEEGFCDEATRDKDWVAYGLLLATGEEPIEEFERVKQCVAACTASKTKEELLEAAMERRLLLAPMTTIEDVVKSEQFSAREFFVTPKGGRFAYPGAFAKFSATPLEVDNPPPKLGEHNDLLQDLAPRQPPTDDLSTTDNTLPLEGLKVLDFMWALAGPGATRILADFGATVVRIESSSKLDVCRTIRPFIEGDELPEKSAVFHTTNAGKRMLTLDLTKPDGQAVVRDLVKWADVVTESFSPRAMKAFGLDYAALKEINPDIIMLSTCLMGQSGPLSLFAGYGNLAAAVAGFYNITGWADREPAGPFGAYTDYIAPKFNASAVLAALDHRRRTGQGQHIDLAQAEAAMHFLTPAILDYTANGVVQARIGNRDLNYAPHGAYPTAGEDQWLAIACETESQWQALVSQIPDLSEYAEDDAQSRLNKQDELDDIIARYTQNLDGFALEERLQAAGVPAAVVQNSEQLLKDHQLQHANHFIKLPHHEAEYTYIENARVHLSRSPVHTETSAPTFARDMMYVLQDVLAYDDDRVGELLVSGVLD